MKSRNVIQYGWIDNSMMLPNFGAVTVQVLWPPPHHNDANENNNSLVIAMTLGRTSFVLTGDAEASVWSSISSQIHKEPILFLVVSAFLMQQDIRTLQAISMSRLG